MNKKGFTLVELLAVIAMVAILTTMALPNVLKIFSSVKKEAFTNEVNQIIKTSKQQYLMNGAKGQVYHNVDGSKNKLLLTNDSNLQYYIKLDDN